jgi:MFS transporter, DHA1 family, inner membrane transport protein
VAFFRNSAVNLLNLHYGLHAIALYGGGAFFLVYLLKAGLSVPAVLLSFALVLFGRFVIRPAVIGPAVRWGLRRMVMAGTLLSALQYPLLAEVHGVGPALFALIVMAAIADTIYWTSYHAYFAALGDDEHRGHQLGAREAIAAGVGIVSPLLSGWLLVSFGARVAFGASAIIVALAALPFLWTPEVKVARQATGAFKAARLGLLLFMADGWIAAGYIFLWQIVLFVSLGESFLAYGGALALAAFAGAIGGLLLGRHIDAGHGRRAVWYACGVIASIIALRALATHSASLAVLANALGALGGCLYVPTLLTAVYNQSKRSPCPLRFQVATEGGWDIGGAGGLVISAALIALGAHIWTGILLSLAGVAVIFVALRRYYTNIADASAVVEMRPDGAR